MQQIRMGVSAFLHRGAELWLAGDPTNNDEVKQGRRARNDVKNRGLFSSWKMRSCNLLGCISEMEPDGQICASVAALPCMTKGSSQRRTLLSQKCVRYFKKRNYMICRLGIGCESLKTRWK